MDQHYLKSMAPSSMHFKPIRQTYLSKRLTLDNKTDDHDLHPQIEPSEMPKTALNDNMEKKVLNVIKKYRVGIGLRQSLYD